ncbi:MAG: UDP-N-acetylglucosamine 2-epimerase [Saprospiraceae bacterium]|nr:UDP-N-acetylglucosamine 2-epimerase [Saprospiraceae bacterium]
MHRSIDNEPSLRHVIVHSGQHYDFEMSGQFFDELEIPAPDYNLEIGSGHHVEQMAKCMVGLVDVFNEIKPDMVLVYGDTNTTSAAAISAAKCNIKLAHIEAGLREHDRSIPEECK